MRPRINRLAPAFWIVREQACFKFEAALYEHPNPVPSLPNRFFEAKFRFAASFHSQTGERYYLYVTKLYVGNLAFQTTSQELQELFASGRNS